jgi:hypothetical protein
MRAYETFHVVDPDVAEMAIDLVEDTFGDVHEWLPCAERGEWIVKHTCFYVVFLDDVYRGYFCLLNYGKRTYLHFGTIGKALSYHDVLYGVAKAQCIARNVYGISELFCEVDAGGIIDKLCGKLGFEPTEQANTYSIKYHGQET